MHRLVREHDRTIAPAAEPTRLRATADGRERSTRNGGRRSGTGVAAALAEVARTLDAQRTLEETLEGIVRIAVSAVPGFCHAGISVTRPKGVVGTLAATAPIVRELDRLQYDAGEGPCLDALTREPMVRVEGARHEQRWPGYLAGAVRLGLRSQLSLHLFTDRSMTGALNFYSLERDTIDDQAPRIAELFAVHAAVALGRAREVDGLHEALSTRKTIGQAVGILMERYRLDEDRAFQYLLRSSQQANIKVRDIAAELVRGTGLRREA